MNDLNLERQLLDAIPSAIFVVDERLRILDSNAATRTWLKADPQTAVGHLFGDALHCMFAQGPQGCGHSTSCPACVLRSAANEAFANRQQVQRRFRLDLQSGNQIERRPARVTAAPFTRQDSQRAFLVLDDLAEVVELQRIFPICAACKRPRTDADYWSHVEAYLQRHLDLTFTHCLCPDCLKTELAKLDDLLARCRLT